MFEILSSDEQKKIKQHLRYGKKLRYIYSNSLQHKYLAPQKTALVFYMKCLKSTVDNNIKAHVHWVQRELPPLVTLSNYNNTLLLIKKE